MWYTKRWPIRVFTFLIAVTEVNVFLILRFFVWKTQEKKKQFHHFRKDLAFSLIYNQYLTEEVNPLSPCSPSSPSKRPRLRSGHQLLTKPPYTGTWNGNMWNKSKVPYQQYLCSNTKCSSSKSEGRAQVRTYCSCNVGKFLCHKCWGEHLTSEAVTSGLPIQSLKY